MSPVYYLKLLVYSPTVLFQIIKHIFGTSDLFCSVLWASFYYLLLQLFLQLLSCLSINTLYYLFIRTSWHDEAEQRETFNISLQRTGLTLWSGVHKSLSKGNWTSSWTGMTENLHQHLKWCVFWSCHFLFSVQFYSFLFSISRLTGKFSFVQE